MSFAFVFPGQGSQSVGMLSALAASSSSSCEVRSTRLRRCWATTCGSWCRKAPGSAWTRPSARSRPCWAPAWPPGGFGTSAAGRDPALVSGHSLGEFTALVCAGCAAISRRPSTWCASAARSCRRPCRRVPGAMAAILGLDDAEVEAACAEAAQGEVVEAVNFNSPGQVVIAGETGRGPAGDRSRKARGAKRAVVLAGERAVAQQPDAGRPDSAWQSGWRRSRSAHRSSATSVPWMSTAHDRPARHPRPSRSVSCRARCAGRGPCGR